MKTVFSSFLSSFFGMYITQSCVHAFIGVLIVDRAIQIWDIGNPLIRQRFRMVIIFSALFSYPFYQLMNPERGDIAFRLETLFDSSRWLNLELWNAVPLGILFILLLVFTSFVFFFQELGPIIKHTVESDRTLSGWEKLDDQSEIVRGFRSLTCATRDIADFYITVNEHPILFARTGKRPSIHLSTGIVDSLTAEELQGAIAHETAHILRNRRPLLTVVFFLRMLLFFNPVVLVVFRRLVLDEEKICDDMAIASTKNPYALAETLKKLYYKPEADADGHKNGAAVARPGGNMHVEKRIRRIEGGVAQCAGGQWGKLIAASIANIIINYFVV
jgi:Zn-dependent protease with chaperone function